MPRAKKVKFRIKKIRKRIGTKNAVKSLFFSAKTIRYLKYGGVAIFTIAMMFVVGEILFTYIWQLKQTPFHYPRVCDGNGNSVASSSTNRGPVRIWPEFRGHDDLAKRETCGTGSIQVYIQLPVPIAFNAKNSSFVSSLLEVRARIENSDWRIIREERAISLPCSAQ